MKSYLTYFPFQEVAEGPREVHLRNETLRTQELISEIKRQHFDLLHKRWLVSRTSSICLIQIEATQDNSMKL